MTWKELKEAIDKQLKERGISEDTEIWYIDISFPIKDNLKIYGEEMGISIAN
jgi:hypothetical protein